MNLMHCSKHHRQHWQQQSKQSAIFESAFLTCFWILARIARVRLIIARIKEPNANVPRWYLKLRLETHFELAINIISPERETTCLNLPPSVPKGADHRAVASVSFIPSKVPFGNRHCYNHVTVGDNKVTSPKEAEQEEPESIIDIIIKLIRSYLIKY